MQGRSDASPISRRYLLAPAGREEYMVGRVRFTHCSRVCLAARTGGLKPLVAISGLMPTALGGIGRAEASAAAKTPRTAAHRIAWIAQRLALEALCQQER